PSFAAVCWTWPHRTLSLIESSDFRPSLCVAPCCRLLLLVASKGQEKGNVPGAFPRRSRIGERQSPSGPNLTDREISFRKVSARAQEGHIGELRRRIRQAIAKVQRGLVVASTEPGMRVDRGFPVVLAKGHDAHTPVGQKALKKQARIHRQSRSQDERCFDQGGSSNRQRVRLIELRKEIATLGFFRGNRDDRRGIQDQTPSGP